jgi:hypothetical protein
MVDFGAVAFLIFEHKKACREACISGALAIVTAELQFYFKMLMCHYDRMHFDRRLAIIRVAN